MHDRAGANKTCMAAIKNKTSAAPTTSHCQSHSLFKPGEVMRSKATLAKKSMRKVESSNCTPRKNS